MKESTHKMIKIGTRTSPLALAQAQEVAACLGVAYEIIGIKTSGDRFAEQALSEIGGKALFTKELEEALIEKTIDIAVHSLKDVPAIMPPQLVIEAVLPREDPRDALICTTAQNIAGLPYGAVFGTSSPRRAAQILHLRPDLRVVSLRGNVQTRIQKIAAGEAAATMLAQAGLNRLQLANIPATIIPLTECLPAVGQGAIGIECRDDDYKIRELLARINCPLTMAAVKCEREFLRILEGSCRSAIAGYARIDGNIINFKGLIADNDGKNLRRVSVSGDIKNAIEIGAEAAAKIKQAS